MVVHGNGGCLGQRSRSLLNRQQGSHQSRPIGMLCRRMPSTGGATMGARQQRLGIVGFVLCLLAFGVVSCAETDSSPSTAAPGQILLPAPVDTSEALWGFIDSSGNVVIRPRFDGSINHYLARHQGFHQGLAVARLNDTVGYIDKTGNG
jgi:hypothetical protein